MCACLTTRACLATSCHIFQCTTMLSVRYQCVSALACPPVLARVPWLNSKQRIDITTYRHKHVRYASKVVLFATPCHPLYANDTARSSRHRASKIRTPSLERRPVSGLLQNTQYRFVRIAAKFSPIFKLACLCLHAECAQLRSSAS
jgi:hypothetical protein